MGTTIRGIETFVIVLVSTFVATLTVGGGTDPNALDIADIASALVSAVVIAARRELAVRGSN